MATACGTQPFVRGLDDGSLPPSVVRVYVARDASFLEAFARAYAFALARSPDRSGLDAFNTLTRGVLGELRCFRAGLISGDRHDVAVHDVLHAHGRSPPRNAISVAAYCTGTPSVRL